MNYCVIDYVIWDFHDVFDEDESNFWNMTTCWFAIIYWCFRQSCWLRLRGWPRIVPWTDLKLETHCSFETWTNNYQSTHRHAPEDCNPHFENCYNLPQISYRVPLCCKQFICPQYRPALPHTNYKTPFTYVLTTRNSSCRKKRVPSLSDSTVSFRLQSMACDCIFTGFQSADFKTLCTPSRQDARISQNGVQ